MNRWNADDGVHHRQLDRGRTAFGKRPIVVPPPCGASDEQNVPGSARGSCESTKLAIRGFPALRDASGPHDGAVAATAHDRARPEHLAASRQQRSTRGENARDAHPAIELSTGGANVPIHASFGGGVGGGEGEKTCLINGCESTQPRGSNTTRIPTCRSPGQLTVTACHCCVKSRQRNALSQENSREEPLLSLLPGSSWFEARSSCDVVSACDWRWR